jgi:uncharacterized protein YbcI
MSTSEPRLTDRQQLAAISRSMAGLQREHYGRESTKVNAYAIADMIVVVVRLKQPTALEKLMVEGGEPDRVLALRAAFDRVMAERYTDTVEQVTGATVVALLSQAHVDPDIIVEPRRPGRGRLTSRPRPRPPHRVAARTASLVEDSADDGNSECGGRNVVR